MTTSAVMTITDEVLAELEAAASDSKLNIYRPFGWPHSVRCGNHLQTDQAFLTLISPETILALLRHIAELKERCAAAEKDAGRYAWIRDQHNDGLGRTWVAVYQPGEWVSLDTFVSGVKAEVLNLDMAVDAAIQSQGEMT